MCQTNVENGLIIPGRYQSIIEIFYETINSMIRDNIAGKEGYRFFPFVFTLFIFILINNLFGLLPYTFATTSHIAGPVGFSVAIFIATLIIGFKTYQLDYLSRFMPAGVPLAMGPVLVLIEINTYFLTAFVLGIRLMGNIVAGHMLFAIISSFAFKMAMSGTIGIMIASLLPFVILLAVTVLEMAVAFIQAYVYVLLTVIYLNDALHLH
jgi:ATP synthase subunit 6